FCQLHQDECTTIPLGVAEGWPTVIDFEGLEIRIKKHADVLRNIVDRVESSSFLEEAKKKGKGGGSRSMGSYMANFDVEQPGYYGYQGYKIFVRTLENMFTKDPSLPHHLDSVKAAPLTPDYFIQRVLIPELASCLIAKDINLDRNDTHVRATLEGSRAFGAAVFPIPEVSMVAKKVHKPVAQKEPKVQPKASASSISSLPTSAQVQTAKQKYLDQLP
ncbi:hypothetical protein DFH28DRAFT_902010, partial [Melampsora americana]